MKSDEQLMRRVYSALLHLYPAEFHRGYAHELTLLFVDMHREAATQGIVACAQLWLTALLDLVSNATSERLRSMREIRWQTVVSIVLCLPLLFLITTATLNYEPPFVKVLNQYILSADGYTPTMLGRIVMICLLLSAPAAFVINFLPM